MVSSIAQLGVDLTFLRCCEFSGLRGCIVENALMILLGMTLAEAHGNRSRACWFWSWCPRSPSLARRTSSSSWRSGAWCSSWHCPSRSGPARPGARSMAWHCLRNGYLSDAERLKAVHLPKGVARNGDGRHEWQQALCRDWGVQDERSLRLLSAPLIRLLIGVRICSSLDRFEYKMVLVPKTR